MNSRLASALVNGGLMGLAAIALFPLLWMLSVSFMTPGEAGAMLKMLVFCVPDCL